LQFALQLQFYTAHAAPDVTAITQRASGMIPVLLKGTASQPTQQFALLQGTASQPTQQFALLQGTASAVPLSKTAFFRSLKPVPLNKTVPFPHP